MESLKGIFPQSQPAPKRNFLKENVQRIRKLQQNRKQPTEYSNQFNKIKPARKQSFAENNAPHRSTHLLALSSSKAPLRKSISTLSIGKEMGTQTVDPDKDDFFLKDSIIRYPSASTLRSSRPPSSHQVSTCTRGHQMEPSNEEHRPRFRSHFHNRKDEHCEKMDRHISNLSDFLDNGSISKDKHPPSILKNSSSTRSSTKSSKNYLNEFQRKENRSEKSEDDKQLTVEISSDDDDDVQKEKRAPTEKELDSAVSKQQPNTAEDDPDCPEGMVKLSETERENALKIAKKRFKDLVDDLNRLPMTSETLRVRMRKIEIEKELRGLENNIRVFSRPKVYVKLE